MSDTPNLDRLLTPAQRYAAERGKPLTKGRWAGHRQVSPGACRECGRAIPYRSPSRAIGPLFCNRKCAGIYHARQAFQPRALCKVCGKPAPSVKQKSCSKACADILRRKFKARVCPVCRKSYFPKATIRHRYCSRECYAKVRADKAFETIVCAKCGRTVRRRKVRTRPRKYHFCSRECSLGFLAGERHSMWRGGTNPNRGRKWLKIAEQVRQRDEYTCKRCGRTQAENGEKLSVDHIKPWRSFASEREANELSNLVSLCRGCHATKTHGAERAWLRGDRLLMAAYERSIYLPSAVKGKS